MKDRITVVLIGSVALQTYLWNFAKALNLRGSKLDISMERDFDHSRSGEPVMPKAAQIFIPMPAFRAASEKSDVGPLDPILLFGGIGLSVFLIAILTGVQGVWY